MIELYDLLQKIKDKPGMYLGYPSVSNLFMFLCGYKCSRRDLGISLSEQEREFQEFQPWVQEKFKVSTEASWAKIILLFSGEESRAFTTFFDLLEEFLNRNNKSAQMGDAANTAETVKDESLASST